MIPKRWKVPVTAVVVVLSSVFIAMVATRSLTFLSALENIASDIRIAAFQKAMPQSKDIVIAAITEQTVTRFPYRSPVDRAFLAGLLKSLESKGARMIGLDVLFDQSTEADKDELLKQTIRSIKTPLFISYTTTSSIVNEDQLRYLNDFVPLVNRAGANLSTDPFDGAVRWIFPGQTDPNMPLGFSRKAAQLAGIQTPAELTDIVWRAPPDADTSPFPIYPAHVVSVLPDDWFKNKIVLIGAVLSITDRHRTPLAVVYDGDRGMMPGVLIQAHGIAQYLEGRRPSHVPVWLAVLVTACTAAAGVVVGLLKRGVVFNVVAGMATIALLWLGAMYGFTYGLPLIPLVAPTLALALALWITDILIGSAERKQREFVQNAFSRYVSPAVVGQLVDNPESLTISGVRREATFIFTDIAGFTTLSEQLSSDQLSAMLNAYLDGACQIILRYEGTVDKFIGDAIMAIFNAPIEQADHPRRAVLCALELDAYAESFAQQQRAQGVPLGVTRIGLHTGTATIGNFGSTLRMDFTALGDTVNTAARTEGVNKYFGTRVCCTQEVVSRCPGMDFMPIGDVVLKGKAQAITLYSPIPAEQALLPLYPHYLRAYGLLQNGDTSAASVFADLYSTYPDHPLIVFHHDRITRGLCTNRVVMEDK